MNCPYCGHQDSQVIDSRDASEGVRRRRKCLQCGGRFTTYERFHKGGLFVIKKDKRREEFSKDKLLTGIRKACEKRPLPTGAIDKMADDIESELYRLGKAEVPSRTVGDMVMEKLKALDYIAYIRFASVYLDFGSIADLKKAVDSLVSGETAVHPSEQLPLIPSERIVKNRTRIRASVRR
ncbi:MAG: transcriptional regulator NrdR [Candidatus Altiarchaeota archaeon]